MRGRFGLLFLVALTACAAPGEQQVAPDWVVDGTAEAYPQARYMTASASAPDRASARDRARTELARAFHVRIDADARHTDRLEFRAGATSHHSSLDQRVETRTQQELSGVEIAAEWHDAEAGRYHALAVLHRQQAAAALAEEIAALDASTAAYLAQADQLRDDPLRAAHYIGAALAEQRLREDHQQALRVLRGSGVSPPYQRSLLEAMLARQRAAVNFQVEASGAHASYLSERLEAVLGNAGFGADATSASATEYLLDAHLTLEERGRQDGWYWLRGGLSVTVVAGGGAVVGGHSWSFRAAATDPATVEQRILDKVAKAFEQELLAALLKP